MKMSLQCLSRSVASVIPFVVVCIESGHIFYPVTGIAANNESHYRRRRCFRSTSRSRVISIIMKRFTATLALGQRIAFLLFIEPGRCPSLHQALSLS
jgi:hypothetical protein